MLPAAPQRILRPVEKVDCAIAAALQTSSQFRRDPCPAGRMTVVHLNSKIRRTTKPAFGDVTAETGFHGDISVIIKSTAQLRSTRYPENA